MYFLATKKNYKTNQITFRHVLSLYRPGVWGRPESTSSQSSNFQVMRTKRSPGGGQQKFGTPQQAETYSRGAADTQDVRFLNAELNSNRQCGVQGVPYIPPSYSRRPRIRNGTCTPYGAFPWTVQIQVYTHILGVLLLKC